MKTTLLLAVSLFFLLPVLHAQIEKGRIQIGGTINVNHQKSENPFITNSEYTNVNVSPSLGQFYKTNKMAGVFLNYGYSESPNVSSISHAYGGGVFLRQYQPVINKLYLFVDERGSYMYQSGKNASVPFHGYNVGASVQAGMAYDIAKKMQLELLINNLLYANYSNMSDYENYNIGTSLEGNSFQGITLGFRFYLK